MKIGVNTLFLIPGEVGGTETYLRETLGELARSFPSTGIALFTNNENDQMFRELFRDYPQFAFHHVPCNASNRYARIIIEQTILPRYVSSAKVDLLWSPGYTAPFFSSCPQVVTIPDMQYKHHPEDLSFLARLATDILVTMSAKRCQKIIAISEFTRQEIFRYTHAAPDKISVTHLAADPVFGHLLSPEERRKRLSDLLSAGQPYILCVANSYPHKNLHMLVSVFGDICNQILHDLVLVGKPRLGESQLQEALSSLSDKNRVHRIDHVDQDQLIALYQGADLFVFPSLYEGFGLPVLEAMMAGTLVIATRKGSIPEVGGDCIIYFDVDRSGDLSQKIMSTLYLSKDQHETLVHKAQAHAESFSWKLTAAKTIECLKQMNIAHG